MRIWGEDYSRYTMGVSLKRERGKDIPVVVVWIEKGADESAIPTEFMDYEVVKRDRSPAFAQMEY